ncbi:MAG: hypothetical protein GKR94_11075 [Gammaproteobacteria bacterium]|nr:hypothetical protein [Gammaproteobacteria bacterium]
MIYEVIFTDSAHQDFYEILDYIAKDNPQNALNFIDRLFIDRLQQRTKNTLAIAPFGGALYKNGIRFLPFDNYVVVYEPNETHKQVFVYMVSERHRQWRSILDARMTDI